MLAQRASRMIIRSARPSWPHHAKPRRFYRATPWRVQETTEDVTIRIDKLESAVKTLLHDTAALKHDTAAVEHDFAGLRHDFVNLKTEVKIDKSKLDTNNYTQQWKNLEGSNAVIKISTLNTIMSVSVGMLWGHIIGRGIVQAVGK